MSTLSTLSTSTMAALSVFLISSCIEVAVQKHYAERFGQAKVKPKRIKKKHIDNSAANYPPHILREMVKQRRRLSKIKELAMKTPLYDNVRMLVRELKTIQWCMLPVWSHEPQTMDLQIRTLTVQLYKLDALFSFTWEDPDGILLCTISKKKGRWYVKKGIGEYTDDSNGTVKLLFEPKNRSQPGEASLYARSDKVNQCVCCGDTENHMRFYVVPYAYRRLLPDKFKSHLSHDIVILCHECYVRCSQERQRRMNNLEEELRPPDSKPQSEINSELCFLRKCALALLRSNNKLPETKRVEYEGKIKAHLGLMNPEDTGNDVLTTAQLQSVVETNYRIENPEYIPGPVLVIRALGDSDETISEFVREWRRFFLDNFHPRFLPLGWSVDNPLISGTG